MSDYQPELDTSQPIEDQTNRELRAKIAHKTGHRPPRTRLTKPILNSAHAYLTGEFHTDKWDMEPGVPPREDILRDTVGVALQALYDGDPPENAPLVEYRGIIGDKPGDLHTRPMRKAELQDFIRAMERTGDQRDWTGGDNE